MRISEDNIQFGKVARETDGLAAEQSQHRPTSTWLYKLKLWFTSLVGLVVFFVIYGMCQSGLETLRRDSRMRHEASYAAPERNPSSPNAISVTARGLNAAPGAIVCQNYTTVTHMFRLYSASWTDHMQDVLTKGQSQLLRGESTPEPDPSMFGCILVETGTAMQLDPGNTVPVVTVRLGNGKYFKGVTMAPMIVQ
jgi:hypothetical protein